MSHAQAELRNQLQAGAFDIVAVTAFPMNIPVDIEVVGIKRSMSLSACLCEIETRGGLKGYGFTAITEEEVVASAINEVAGHLIQGECALDTERLWERLTWTMIPRGQSGYASHAIAAIDIALWDIKAKALGLPLWRLLGGARSEVPVYTTFGFSFLGRDELVEAARHWVAQGNTRLKMTVAAEAMLHRDHKPVNAVIAEDARRVLAVREAVGDDVEIYIDANCNLDAVHALQLAQRVEEARIGFFEEPIMHNDIRQMADLRQRTSIRIAAGQNEGQAYRFRDMLVQGAVDVVQPNVAITGGYTQCLKIAGLASAFNVSYANGGAWPFHNMHIHAGLANGSLVEYHHPAVLMSRMIYKDLPEARNGKLALPETPGLGFEPDLDAVRELCKRPSARGRGKG
ncbi:mandelate racemase/muconate lactonizing enzyme family protein [Stutzerimonas azotifigens]|uniref:mandelate racemase/muconate lactonizing enzyme family protein n=1 Tax=Stutzerimonas azotifigens TaxID=291995 RepID=UPI0004149504|nr:mandelate racemase/muconate lactonizing enzyme family protein [Stutzerimonas azotifigens]